MRVTLFRTTIYERSVSKLPQGTDVSQIERRIAEHPLGWPVIPGTGGIRKARFGTPGKGTRGGGRLCYVYLLMEGHVYLLKAYAKNAQTDLTPDDKKQLKHLVQTLKEEPWTQN